MYITTSYARVYRLLSLGQVEDQQVEDQQVEDQQVEDQQVEYQKVEDQQVEGVAMLYADLDVECLERRSSHAQPRGDYLPTQYADIDFSRPAGLDRGSN